MENVKKYLAGLKKYQRILGKANTPQGKARYIYGTSQKIIRIFY